MNGHNANGYNMKGHRLKGQGFCGRGSRQGQGSGNPLPYCRRDPSLPSGRAAMAATGNTATDKSGEAEYLKNTAAWLNSRLEAVNKRISELGG